MSGPTQGFTCLGSAATLTAAPPLDLATANVLQLYMASVASRGGNQCFDVSRLPSPTIYDAPRWKRQANAWRRVQENLRRAAWVA
jgi:hypothetical protein